MLCLSCLWLATALVLAAQPADLESRLSEKIESIRKKSGAPSVSVAVVKGGKILYAHAFGEADMAAHRTADTRTRYAVGSISKQFTAAALLMAQEQGRLSLDDPVAKYLPDLTRAGEITIRQLLSHTAGYEDYAPQDYIIPAWTRPTTPQAIVDGWAKKPLNFDPGTRWQYSNTNYVAAGAVFEKAMGRPLVPFLKEKIFDPLDMQSAGDCVPTAPGDALAYTRYASGPPRPVGREAAGWYFAAGELCMTPSDLARWDIAFLQKKLLSARSYEEFTREVRLQNGDATHYALGLSLGEFNNIPTVQHSGEVSGFLASNTVYPTRGGAIVVLSNQDGMGINGAVTREVATTVFLPDKAVPSEKETRRIQTVLEGLRDGRIDRSQFTGNANSYFNETALKDLKASLTAVGKLQSVTQAGENLRGGMTHRSYRAQFTKKTLSLNIYVTAEGKFEQFMVEDQP
jgi:D-alanyl-D-alanine carboxypeptidase